MTRVTGAKARILGLTMCIAVVASVAAQTPASAPPVFSSYDTVKVADGIYAFIAPESKTGFVSGNSVVVIGEDSVLVVDTGHVPSLTRRMIADIRRLTDKPVRYIVNTHWHPDHNAGNGEYLAAFPGASIISTGPTREQYAAALPQYADPNALEASVKRVQDALKTGKRSNGTPLTEEEKQYYAAAISDYDYALAEMRLARHTPPSATFSGSLKIFLGKREVQVMFLGRGNTAGDAVIYVPDAKTVMSGDLLVNPTPYAYGSFFTEWVETLKKVRALGASTIVPGHGLVEHDNSYLDQVIALLESTTSQVQAAVKEGLTLDETRKKIDLVEFQKKFAGNDPDRTKAFQSGFVSPGVERAYKEAKEGPLKTE